MVSQEKTPRCGCFFLAFSRPGLSSDCENFSFHKVAVRCSAAQKKKREAFFLRASAGAKRYPAAEAIHKRHHVVDYTVFLFCYNRHMADITFITGNQNKADYLAKYLGFPVSHKKVDLDEIQSLDLKAIVDHKVRQAYAVVKSPVLVEDVALEFSALGRFPGTFIKFLVDEVPFETICRMLDGMNRDAVARCVFGYYDGVEVLFFEGQLRGAIADHPSGENGFGWDRIFIPEGYSVTRAELSEKDDQKTYTTIKPFAELKDFLKLL